MPEVIHRPEVGPTDTYALELTDFEYGLIVCALKAAQVRRWSIDAAEAHAINATFGEIAAKVEGALSAAGLPIPAFTPRPAV